MGSEKPLLEIGGRRLVERVAAAVSPCVAELVLVTNREDLYAFLGLEMVPDIWPGRGPLAGIHAALARLTTDAALVVACDYPFLDQSALRPIVSEDPAGGVVVPRIAGRLQPLCAQYDASILPVVETSVSNGELTVASLLDRLPKRVLEQDRLGGPAAARSFFNVNTPEDLRRAEEMLAEAQPRR